MLYFETDSSLPNVFVVITIFIFFFFLCPELGPLDRFPALKALVDLFCLGPNSDEQLLPELPTSSTALNNTEGTSSQAGPTRTRVNTGSADGFAANTPNPDSEDVPRHILWVTTDKIIRLISSPFTMAANSQDIQDSSGVGKGGWVKVVNTIQGYLQHLRRRSVDETRSRAESVIDVERGESVDNAPKV